MKVTIDSSERLEHVLRVVGALYDVRLSVADGDEGTQNQPTPRAARKTTERRPARGRGRQQAAKKVDTSAVRQWAREQGHQVNDRGRIPNSVVRAYQEAVGGA